MSLTPYCEYCGVQFDVLDLLYCCVPALSVLVAAMESVLLGEAAEDSCECASLFLNADTGECGECMF